jgi:hypothetical protein
VSVIVPEYVPCAAPVRLTVQFPASAVGCPSEPSVTMKLPSGESIRISPPDGVVTIHDREYAVDVVLRPTE